MFKKSITAIVIPKQVQADNDLFTRLEMLKQVQHDNDLFAGLEIPKQSWIIGSSDGSTQSSLGRAGFTPFTRRTYQNPQFRMTIFKQKT